MTDGVSELIGKDTRFGDPLRAGWPWPTGPGRPYTKAWYETALAEALISSTARLAVGFAVGIAIGGIVGALCWRYRPIDDFLGPVLLGVQTLPSVCWVPLAILLIGLNEPAILFVMVMGSFSAVAIALRDGLRAIPPLYQQAGRMMGARGWRLYWYVLLPASMPALATSLRQGFSFAWRSLMGGEMLLVVTHHGLGHRLDIARSTQAANQVVLLIIIMILIGTLADRFVFAKVQQRVSRRFGLTPAEG